MQDGARGIVSPQTCVYIREDINERLQLSKQSGTRTVQPNISLQLYTYIFSRLTSWFGVVASASRNDGPHHNTYIWMFLRLRDSHIHTSYTGIRHIGDCQNNQFDCPNPFSLCFAPIPIANAMVREHNMELVGKTFGVILRWFSFPTGALCVFFSPPEHGRCSRLCFVTHTSPLHLFDSFRHGGVP